MAMRRVASCLISALLIALPGICVSNPAASDSAPPFLEILERNGSRWIATGTVATDDQTIRMAIIEDIGSGSAVSIRQGSRIFDGVRVEEVHRDFVTLLVDGKRVNLRLGSGIGQFAKSKPAATPVIGLERTSPSRFGVSYDDFRSMLGAVPLYSGENSILRVRGSGDDSLLQIKAVQPSGLLDRLGLEAGDVIVAMQGEAIDGFAHAEAVLNAVRPGSTLLLVYRRAESVRQLSIEVTREDANR